MTRHCNNWSERFRCGGPGLGNAAVFFFVNGVEKWCRSNGLMFPWNVATTLLDEALKCQPNLARIDNHDGNVLVGSIVESPLYQVLLVQLLSNETATKLSSEERMRELAERLFGSNLSFRQSVAGVLGSVKKECNGQSLDQAVEYFNSKYINVKYTGERANLLSGADGQEYLRLYLQRWFQ